MHVPALDQRLQPVACVSYTTMAWKRSGVRVPSVTKLEICSIRGQSSHKWFAPTMRNTKGQLSFCLASMKPLRTASSSTATSTSANLFIYRQALLVLCLPNLAKSSARKVSNPDIKYSVKFCLRGEKAARGQSPSWVLRSDL